MPRTRERLFCGYQGNTNDVGGVQGQWEEFPLPSSTFETWRNEGSGNLTIEPSRVAFKWTGPSTWFRIDASANCLKPTAGTASRTLEFCWFKNLDEQAGIIRQTHMNNQDASFLSGSGWILLETNDILYPKIRNTENNEQIRLFNVTFCISEDSGW